MKKLCEDGLLPWLTQKANGVVVTLPSARMSSSAGLVIPVGNDVNPDSEAKSCRVVKGSQAGIQTIFSGFRHSKERESGRSKQHAIFYAALYGTLEY